MKTRSAAKKRFDITGKKKIKRRGAAVSHLLEKKSKSRKRDHKVAYEVVKGNLKNVKKMLGM